jgi:hypothetical protein
VCCSGIFWMILRWFQLALLLLLSLLFLHCTCRVFLCKVFIFLYLLKLNLSISLHVPVNLSARWGWVVNATPQSLYPREGDLVPIVQKWVGPTASLDKCRKPRLPRIRSPDRPYRPRYASPTKSFLKVIIYFFSVEMSLHLQSKCRPALCRGKWYAVLGQDP